MLLHIDKLLFPQRLQADFTHPDPLVVDAYQLCRIAEHAVDPIQGYWPPNDQNAMMKLIRVRILGHLLSQSGLLSDTAISVVANDILCCRGQGADEADVAKLDKLGEFYKNYLIVPFRKCRGKTSNVASQALGVEPLVRLTDEEVSQMVFVAPRNYDESRTQAKIREDYRCIATRILDVEYARPLRMAGPIHERVERVECCHIFTEPEPATTAAVDGGENKQSGTNSSKNRNRWTLLKRLGYAAAIVEHFATSESIHSLDNVMMVTRTVQNDFDTLDLWFEPVQNAPNRYRMCSIWELPYGLPDGHEVAFQSADPRLALPNREYLAVHAACCRVAHLSGVSGLFAELERDIEASPDPTISMEEAGFGRALDARLEDLEFTPGEAC